MSLTAWKETYSVNIRELDEQHRRLLGLVEQLRTAMRQGRGKEELRRIFDGLVAYTATHFACEERLMEAHGFPEYEEHQRIHAAMTRKVLDLQRQFHCGRLGLSLEVLKFLEEWVEKHILGTDKKYGPFLNQRGVT
ncbi:MAG: bacteriohemerythrin [Syntrophobacterales bacterium]|nr:bacteriohemerythrin [Syntrophobacterales bacterium]